MYFIGKARDLGHDQVRIGVYSIGKARDLGHDQVRSRGHVVDQTM